MNLAKVELLLSQNKHELAEKEVKLYLTENPESGIAHAYLSSVFLMQGKKKECLEEAQKAVGFSPDSAFSHYILSRAWLHNDNLKKAQEAIEACLNYNPDDEDYLNLYAIILNDNKDYQKALGIVERVLQLDPEHGSGKQTKSIILRNLGKYEEADAIAGESLKENPEDSYAFASKGWSTLDAGRPKESLELFKSAVMLDPTNEYAKSGLVMALKAKNPLFNLFYKYYNWINTLSPGVRWGFVIGIIILARISGNISESNSSFAPLFGVLFVLYIIFVFLAWTINPIFNIFLRFNRYGKHALNKGEVMASNFMAVLLISAVAMYALTHVSEVFPITGAIGAAFLTLPLTGTFNRWDTPKFKIHAAYTVLLAVLWVLNIVLPLTGSGFMLLWYAFLIGVVGYTWVSQIGK